MKVFDEAVVTFLPFGKQGQVHVHGKLAYFSEVNWEQTPLFESKLVDCNLGFLLMGTGHLSISPSFLSGPC